MTATAEVTPPSSHPRPGPSRHRGVALRWARCGHQHHAPDPAVPGCRGDSPRTRPLGRRKSSMSAIQEDAHAVADLVVSGGGTSSFSAIMVDELKPSGALGQIRGLRREGAARLLPMRSRALHRALGSRESSARKTAAPLGLEGMIRLDRRRMPLPVQAAHSGRSATGSTTDAPRNIARMIVPRRRCSTLESRALTSGMRPALSRLRKTLRGRVAAPAPVLGLTGTGGAGKSSVVGRSLVRRFRQRCCPRLSIATSVGRSDASPFGRSTPGRPHPPQRS